MPHMLRMFWFVDFDSRLANQLPPFICIWREILATKQVWRRLLYFCSNLEEKNKEYTSSVGKFCYSSANYENRKSYVTAESVCFPVELVMMHTIWMFTRVVCSVNACFEEIVSIAYQHTANLAFYAGRTRPANDGVYTRHFW